MVKHQWVRRRFQTIRDVRQEYCKVCGKVRKTSLRKQRPKDDEECTGGYH